MKVEDAKSGEYGGCWSSWDMAFLLAATAREEMCAGALF